MSIISEHQDKADEYFKLISEVQPFVEKFQKEYIDDESNEKSLKECRKKLIAWYDNLSGLRRYFFRNKSQTVKSPELGTPITLELLCGLSEIWCEIIQSRLLPLNVKISTLAERGASRLALILFGLGLFISIFLSGLSIYLNKNYDEQFSELKTSLSECHKLLDEKTSIPDRAE